MNIINKIANIFIKEKIEYKYKYKYIVIKRKEIIMAKNKGIIIPLQKMEFDSLEEYELYVEKINKVLVEKHKDLVKKQEDFEATVENLNNAKSIR